MDLSPSTYFMNFLEYFKYSKVIFFGNLLYLIAFYFPKQNKITKILTSSFAKLDCEFHKRGTLSNI